MRSLRVTYRHMPSYVSVMNTPVPPMNAEWTYTSAGIDKRSRLQSWNGAYCMLRKQRRVKSERCMRRRSAGLPSPSISKSSTSLLLERCKSAQPVPAQTRASTTANSEAAERAICHAEFKYRCTEATYDYFTILKACRSKSGCFKQICSCGCPELSLLGCLRHQHACVRFDRN